MSITHDGGVLQGDALLERYNDLAGTSDQRAAWARMCRLAVPVLESFHVDLIHDWASLRIHWDPAGFTFWWGIRHTGTTFSTDERSFRALAYGDIVTYRVDVTFYDHGEPHMRDVIFTPWEAA